MKEAEDKLTGPLLTDEEFYSLLDGKNPSLAKVKKSAWEGKTEEAKKLFADHIRSGGYSEFFFKNRSVVSNRSSDLNKDELLKESERVLSHNLRSVGVTHKYEGDIDWFYNATYNAYPEWTWQLSRHYDVLTVANAYEVFGEEKYAECAIKLLSSWIKQAVRPEEDVPDGATLCWRTIECGIRMSVWPNIFFPILKSPSATDGFILDFYRSLYEHGARLVRSKTENNWRNIELSGLASLCVLFPVFEASEAWRAHTARGVYDHLIRQVHPDGFQFELSTGYHHVVLREAMHGAAILALSGYEMPQDFNETVTKMFEMYAKLVQSGNIIPDINDGRMRPVKAFLPKDGEIEETPLIKWAKSDCGKDGAPDTYTLVLFENAGIVTMRDRWANARTSLLFDAGKLGRAHQHEDKLNLLIYNKGKEILTEGHNYAYDSSDMRKYVLSSFSHNTVTVDGKGQNRKGNYKWEDSMLATVENVKTYASEALDYAVGEYSEAYGSEQEITDVVHKREVLFLKKPLIGNAAVIVIDTLDSENEHTYEALWHLDIPEIILTGNTATAPEVNICFGGDEGVLSVVKGQTEPTVQGFVCRSTIQGDYEPIPTVINKITAKRAKMLTAFTFGENISKISVSHNNVNLTYQDGSAEIVELPI